MHALHTVHALPDLRVAGGRLGDGESVLAHLHIPALCPLSSAVVATLANHYCSINYEVAKNALR